MTDRPARFLHTASFAVAATLLSGQVLAKAILGHEYELEAKPIGEGEQPMIPPDADDLSFKVRRQPRVS